MGTSGYLENLDIFPLHVQASQQAGRGSGRPCQASVPKPSPRFSSCILINKEGDGDAVFGSRLPVSDMAGKPPNVTTYELFVHEKKTVLLQLVFEPLRDLPGKPRCCKTVFRMTESLDSGTGSLGSGVPVRASVSR